MRVWRKAGSHFLFPSHFQIASQPTFFILRKGNRIEKVGRKKLKKGANFRPPQITRSLDLIDNSEMDQKFEIRGAVNAIFKRTDPDTVATGTGVSKRVRSIKWLSQRSTREPGSAVPASTAVAQHCQPKRVG